MAVRVEADPDVRLRLVRDHLRTAPLRPRDRLGQVVDLDVEVDLHRLVAGTGRPDRRHVRVLALEAQPGSPSGLTSTTHSGCSERYVQPSRWA